MAKLVSLKTQNRYAKIYQTYLITLFKNQTCTTKEQQLKMFDNLMSKYSESFDQLVAFYKGDAS